ncbi:terminase small subunit [Citrobacter phage IME-CF2]|uniref:Terminase small subunit n=2 Tax=Pseudotevenvirus TaxID=2842979 RepID=A0A1B1IXG7_9CAUD|nr:terminase small subunit [Citrobacter phage IME-CF2]YP_009285745.1 terminase small subunit [Citrobacter phage vB_CfrM_CfP1]AKR16104.1 terminase small subunit [Citrobacter phage IME-CF2]ANS06026.1 terminase small subunit [Citrobacter phage vB_CfrM_CfP1]QPX73199.1 putative terminase DNA packaging enzyme small subunit [Citrobacter phage vB_Cfr_Xman]
MENLNLQELLNIDSLPGGVESGEDVVVYEKLELKPVESHPADRKPDLEEDYSLARRTAHYMNQMIMDMAEIALHNAKNSESPRHVEVFTGLMNQLNSSNMGLMKIHKEMREITEEKTTTSPGEKSGGGEMNIENATVFVGSPTELMQKYGSAYDPKEGFIDGEVVEVNSDGNGTDDRSE